jgi:hypothetical protein
VPNKPVKLRDYLAGIRAHGWNLEKAGKDWKLVDAKGKIQVRNIIVTHPGKEVPPISQKKTEQALKDAGLI